MTFAEFIQVYPAFATVPQAVVEAVLAEAELTTSDTWTGDRREEFVGVSTARRLHADPGGRPARITDKGAKSPYDARFAELIAGHGCAKNRWG